jgi:hypothetical protein
MRLLFLAGPLLALLGCDPVHRRSMDLVVPAHGSQAETMARARRTAEAAVGEVAGEYGFAPAPEDGSRGRRGTRLRRYSKQYHPEPGRDRLNTLVIELGVSKQARTRLYVELREAITSEQTPSFTRVFDALRELLESRFAGTDVRVVRHLPGRTIPGRATHFMPALL